MEVYLLITNKAERKQHIFLKSPLVDDVKLHSNWIVKLRYVKQVNFNLLKHKAYVQVTGIQYVDSSLVHKIIIIM